MNKTWILAFVMSIADSVVELIEKKFPGASGTSKRWAAWKYIRDRIKIFELLFGPVPLPSDSEILGVIDGTVTHKNMSGQFEKTEGSDAQYVLAVPEAFEVPHPKTGVKQWVRIGDDGELEAVKTKVSADGRSRVPADEPEPAQEPAQGEEGAPVLAGGGDDSEPAPAPAKKAAGKKKGK